MSEIEIIGAREGNLKEISLKIPKNKLVVFTGVSGSGKSTLLIDVLFNECQRQYLEAISLEGIRKPAVDRIRGASPAIAVLQTALNNNPRSTVGTVTDIYTDLRMIYEKLGIRKCPHCGKMISSADCREETEKKGNDFFVYMYCAECGRRMEKITRTHFSFNTKEGACPVCEGLGKIHSVRRDRAVEEGLSLEGGAIRCFEKQYGKYQISVLYKAFAHYQIPVPAHIAVREFDTIQKAVLFEGTDCALLQEVFPKIKPPQTAAAGRFEGIVPILMRRLSEKEGDAGQLEEYFDVVECSACRGERLGEKGRSVTVEGIRLPQIYDFSLERLLQWITGLKAFLPQQKKAMVKDYLLDLETKMTRLIRVGLSYLTVDRQTGSLSGGEMQRLRLAAILDSELTGVIYVLDEPTAGLHPKDTDGLLEILKKLRDLGNSVLVIEHDTDVMAAADYIVDMGPGAGKYGGRVCACGTLSQIMEQEDSVTGRYLKMRRPGKRKSRQAAGMIQVTNAARYNLKKVSAAFPVGCMTAVAGPSGSGKTTLVFEVLAQNGQEGEQNRVSGLEGFDRVVKILQEPPARMKRSNVATYSDVYAKIRAVFAKTEDAKNAGFTAKHFSFNTPGGRCENCEGLGFVDSNMLFFADTRIPCPACHGNRFCRQVLEVKYRGLSIKDVLDLSVDEGARFFADQPKISEILKLLLDVGMGYLELGQTLTTLSGGEGQRLKLAKELIGSSSGRKNLYLLDEPTSGLHPLDIEHFMALLDRMTEAGATVVVVEHNLQLIKNCDWIVELGPEGGEKGGQVVFAGTPEQMCKEGRTVTAQYLRKQEEKG